MPTQSCRLDYCFHPSQTGCKVIAYLENLNQIHISLFIAPISFASSYPPYLYRKIHFFYTQMLLLEVYSTMVLSEVYSTMVFISPKIFVFFRRSNRNDYLFLFFHVFTIIRFMHAFMLTSCVFSYSFVFTIPSFRKSFYEMR